MDPKHAKRWHAEVLKCHACEAKEKTAGRYSKDGGDTAGIYLGVDG